MGESPSMCYEPCGKDEGHRGESGRAERTDTVSKAVDSSDVMCGTARYVVSSFP